MVAIGHFVMSCRGSFRDEREKGLVHNDAMYCMENTWSRFILVVLCGCHKESEEIFL